MAFILSDMIFILYCLVLVHSCFGDEEILHVDPGCPATNAGIPRPVVRADVPAEVTAICKNGDKIFTSTNGVKHVLSATLSQAYVGGDCQYYKKKGVNTYHVNVAVAWSEHGKEVYTEKQVRTITCSYDRHGNATSSRERITNAFLNPNEKQNLKGGELLNANFSLAVIDVLGNELGEDHLHIGRLVRLRAFETTGTVGAFRALSCTASNDESSYAILRAGCGDGLVFEKAEGFETVGSVVYSPYFDAFKLHGSEKVHFECNFTVCDDKCDGDSCKYIVSRSRRSLSDTDPSIHQAPVDQQLTDDDSTKPKVSTETSTKPPVTSSSVGTTPARSTSSPSTSSPSTSSPSTPSPSHGTSVTKTFSLSSEDCTPTKTPSIMLMESANNKFPSSISSVSKDSSKTKVQMSPTDVKAKSPVSIESKQIEGSFPISPRHQPARSNSALLKESSDSRTSVSDLSRDVVVSSMETNPVLESNPTSQGFQKHPAVDGDKTCASPPSIFTDTETLTIIFCVFGSLLFLSFTMSLYLCCKYELAQISMSLKK